MPKKSIGAKKVKLVPKSQGAWRRMVRCKSSKVGEQMKKKALDKLYYLFQKAWYNQEYCEAEKYARWIGLLERGK